MNAKSMLFLCVLCFMYAGVQAQQVIRGTVTESGTGDPLPGVTVLIKGTTEGTTTSFDGTFSIQASPTDTLSITYIGMAAKMVAVGNQTTFNITLTEDVQQLGEVVVVGYGTTSRSLISGSVTQVTAENLQIDGNAGLDGALQGKAAGVQVVQNSGTPGGGISVQVRGANSISAGTQPLYVIDGVPMTTGDFGQIGFEGQNINALTDLNPNDIESISVLKDASSAAIYGARAGNGVVLITTKSGKKGKTQFSLDSYYGVQQVRKKLNMLNADEFVDYLNDVSPGLGNSFNTGISTDWQDEVFREAAIASTNFSANGGNEKTRFFISAGLFDQEGIVLGTDYRRLNGRMNLNHEVNDKLRFSVKTGVTSSLNNRVPGDQSINGVLPNAISKPPVLGVRDENGNYLEQGFWDNPVAVGNEATNETEVFRSISNFQWEYEIIPGLTFKNQWGYDYYALKERRYEPTTTRRGALSEGIGISARSEVSRITQLSTMGYDFKPTEKLDISLLAGYSFEMGEESSNFIRGINFPSDNLEYITSAGTIESASSFAQEFGISSFFGRAKIVYDNKYILTANVRRDGSSNFGDNNKFGTFPGLSLAWRISEEAFFQNIPVLSELKVRAGYGITGNDQIGSFRFLNTYRSGFNYRNLPGIIPNNIPNPDLRWETTAQFDAGLDVGFFNNRLSLSVDYYLNQTTDLLLSRPIPGSTGFSSVTGNVGALRNTGLEVSLGGQVIDKENLGWKVDFNISANRNKVTELFDDQPITDIGRGNNSVIVGHPIGSFYMLNSLGVDPSTGNLVFEDVNGDGQITDADRQIVGNPTPQFFGGLTNSFRYKGFDLTVFFQFVYGNDIFNGVRQYAENMTFGENDNQLSSINNRWRQPGDRVPVPRVNGTFNNDITSHFIEDGSFLRLRNVSVGYNLPKAWLGKVKLKQARLYLNLQNLWVLTNYSGFDPEVNYSGIDPLRAGTDFFTFPQPRSVMGGINIKF